MAKSKSSGATARRPRISDNRPVDLRRGSDMAAAEQLDFLKEMYLKELDRGPGAERTDLNRAKIRMTIEDIQANGYTGQDAFKVSDEDAKAFIKKRTKQKKYI